MHNRAAVLESFAHWLQNVILDLGYPGLFLLIALESTMVPIPSELIMPFAGWQAARGHFSLPMILAINGAGALIGSAFSYWVGAAGGKPLLEKYGKYLLIKHEDLVKTEEFFAKRGAWTVFIARFVPVARHLISVPAGVARMRFDRFLLQTFLGAMIWGGALMVLGYELADNWESFARKAKRVDMIIGVLVLVTALVITVRWWRRRRRNQGTAP